MRNALLVSIIMIASVALNAGETLDRIVATVDRHPITRSDVEQEARFNYLTEGRGGQVTQEDEIAALERLVDRNLIADQVAVFGVVPVTKEDMDARVAEMRKQLPGAETDPGWHRLLSQYGLTDEDISSRVTSAKINRSRDYKLQNPLAASFQINLDNTDKFFSPSYSPTTSEVSSGFVNSELKPNVGVIIRASFVRDS